MQFLGYGRQNIDRSDIDAVVAVLESDFLTQGPQVERFEAALATQLPLVVAPPLCISLVLPRV